MDQTKAIQNRTGESTDAQHFFKTLALCLALAALICYGQIRGSSLLLIGGLTAFLLFCVWGSSLEFSLPILLFFLPWSPLMKLYQGGISFFTIALLICCLVSLAKSGMTVELYQIIITALLAVLTLLAKAVEGNPIANSYLCFLAMILLFPGIAKRSAGADSFWELTLFFAMGIISAALSAQQAVRYPHIAQYVKVDSYLTITRLSGYYGDPNFYAAHISACLAGVQLLLCRERRKARQVGLILIAVILLYCGLLSASKSFAVVLVCQFLVWIPILLEGSGKGGRFSLLLGILCAAMVALSSQAFQDLIRIVDTRFAYATNLSKLTTGRTELWRNYLSEFTRNAKLLLLGEGYTNVTLLGRASHNSVIQGIFQFGILGFPVLLTWMGITLKRVRDLSGIRRGHWKAALLMTIGVALPWMALDILFFDELFLLPVYGAFGVIYMSRPPKDRG